MTRYYAVGWWLVHNDNDKTGWVPSTYLEPVQSKSFSESVSTVLIIIIHRRVIEWSEFNDYLELALYRCITSGVDEWLDSDALYMYVLQIVIIREQHGRDIPRPIDYTKGPTLWPYWYVSMVFNCTEKK